MYVISPITVISAKMKSLSDISPEKDSFSSLDYNFNMAATTSAAPRDLQGEKRRLNSSGSGGAKPRKPKQRRVHTYPTGSSSSGARREGQSPAHSDSSQSPSHSRDAMSASSEALERGEILYADAAPSYAELKIKRSHVPPVLMFPPPPAYSPDKHSPSSASPASSSSAYSPSPHHQMSIESQVEAIMTSPVQAAKPPVPPKPKGLRPTASRVRTPTRAFKRPTRKRASLNSIEGKLTCQ